MKTIYLVRHGESVLNANTFDTYVDDVSAPLTDVGRQQARIIAERAKKLSFEVLIASPFERTKRTAETIAEATGHTIEYSDLFTERKAPDAIVGKLKSDPEAMALIKAGWISSEKNTGAVSGVETFEQLKARAGKALEFLQHRKEDSILVVGHGFFTRMLIARMLLGPTLVSEEFSPFIHGFRTTNTGVSILKYDSNDVHRPWWLQVWNDSAHMG